MKILGNLTIGKTVWVVTGEWDGKYSQMDTYIETAQVVDILKVYSEADKGICTEVKFDIEIRNPDVVCETEAMAKGYEAVLATSNTYEVEKAQVLFKRVLGSKLMSELESLDMKGLEKYKKLQREFLNASTEVEQYEALGRLLLNQIN